jgi:NADPH:quinone reductase-like Zn-dependent oxidoreductase
VVVAELPSSVTLEQGVVLPLGISTAAAGLYQKHFLALPLPGKNNSLERAVLIWGGSSSVGSCAIQLAVASGAEVYTTASPRNFEYCKKLGAKHLFDYHDDDVEDQIVKELHGITVAGAYHAVGADGAVQACARVVDRCKGKAIVVTVRGVPDEGIPSSVRVKAISSSSIFAEGNEVGPYIWREYLPRALSEGSIAAKSDPYVVGQGLRSIQHGLDKQKAGVSAAKVVVNYIQTG